jgi:hypothetical protein
MISRLSLFALAVICAASIAAAQEVNIGPTSVKLTPPQGQCQLSNEKGDEALLVGKMRELIARSNKLLAIYADCDELAQFRLGKVVAFDSYAEYFFPIDALKMSIPPDAITKMCAVMRSKNDDDLAAIMRNTAPDIDRVFPGMKINQPKFLGVLAEEPMVCYSGQLSKITSTSGEEKVQITILAMILLKGTLMAYQQFAPYRSGDTILNLLGKNRANVAALIAANGK